MEVRTLFQGMSIAKAAEVQSLNVNPVRSSEIQSPFGTWGKAMTTKAPNTVGETHHVIR